MDARRSQQRIVNAHPPDQPAQVRVDLRPTSKGAGFPTPVPAEPGSVPSHDLGEDYRDGLQDRWKPSIQLDENKRSPPEPDAAPHLPSRYDELISAATCACCSTSRTTPASRNPCGRRSNRGEAVVAIERAPPGPFGHGPPEPARDASSRRPARAGRRPHGDGLVHSGGLGDCRAVLATVADRAHSRHAALKQWSGTQDYR